MDYECTQAIPLSDYEEETDDGCTNDKNPVAQLLVNCQKGFPETLFPLYEGDNVIGRQQDKVNIYIPLKAISKQHACIEIRGNIHFIYDMESRNKTRREKLFLTPKARYELKDGDTLMFGDVATVYKKAAESKPDDVGSETGSETGSESMLFNISTIDSETSKNPIDPGVVNVSRVEESMIDDDAASDVSVDLLAATQAYGDDGNRVLVGETPMPTRTKGNLNHSKNASDIVVEESPTNNDSTKSNNKDVSGDNSFVFDGPTQAYKDPDENDDNVVPGIFDCPTQAYGNDDDDATDNEGINLDGPTQAYPASPVFDGPTQAYGDQDDEAPTQAYAMEKETMEPTLAYNMDGMKVTKEKSKPVQISKQESGGFSLGKEENDSEFDPAILEGPTQAYPDASDKIDTPTEDSPGYGFIGSTLVSSQGGKPSTQSSCATTVSPPSSMPTQLLTKDSEDATQILPSTSATQILPSTSATQILPSTSAPDAPTQIISSPVRSTKDDIADTLIVSSPKRTTRAQGPKKGVKDEAAATQLLDPSPSPPKRKKKVCIFSDQPTQVFGDDVEATQAYGDEAETQAYGDEAETETQAYGDEAATQAYGDEAATQAYGDEAPTQAYGDDVDEAKVEDLKTQAYGDEGETQAYGDGDEELETQAYGGGVEELETQAYGDTKVDDAETQAHGDARADDMETQAYGDTGADDMETQAYGDAGADDMETQAYGDGVLEVVPDSEAIDSGGERQIPDFPESMEDIFEEDLKRKSHVFGRPADSEEDDDETQPMTEELSDELPDLDANAPVVEQKLDIPPDFEVEADVSDEDKKEAQKKATTKEEIGGEECSSRAKRTKSLKKNSGINAKETDLKDDAIEEKPKRGRRGKERNVADHGINESQDGPVLLNVTEYGLEGKEESTTKPKPDAIKKENAEGSSKSSGRSRRGKAKDVTPEQESSEVPVKADSDEEEAVVKGSKSKNKRGKGACPVELDDTDEEEHEVKASKSKNKRGKGACQAELEDTDEEEHEVKASKSKNKRGKGACQAELEDTDEEEHEVKASKSKNKRGKGACPVELDDTDEEEHEVYKASKSKNKRGKGACPVELEDTDEEEHEVKGSKSKNKRGKGACQAELEDTDEEEHVVTGKASKSKNKRGKGACPAELEDTDEEEPVVKASKSKNKRGKGTCPAELEDTDEEEPVVQASKSKSKKGKGACPAELEDTDEEKPEVKGSKSKSKRGKGTCPAQLEDTDEEEPVVKASKSKNKRGKGACPAELEDTDEEEPVVKASKSKNKRGKGVCQAELEDTDGEEHVVTGKASKSKNKRGKGACPAELEDTDEEEPVVKASKSKNKRGKGSCPAELEDTDEEEPVSKASKTKNKRGKGACPAELEDTDEEEPVSKASKTKNKRGKGACPAELEDTDEKEPVVKGSNTKNKRGKGACPAELEDTDGEEPVSKASKTKNKRGKGACPAELEDTDEEEPEVKGSKTKNKRGKGTCPAELEDTDEEESVVKASKSKNKRGKGACPEETPVPAADISPKKGKDDASCAEVKTVSCGRAKRGKRQTGKQDDDVDTVVSECVEIKKPQPTGKGARSRRQTGRKQDDDDVDSVTSETIEVKSPEKKTVKGKEASPDVTGSKVTRGAMSRRSLPAGVLKEQGTPRKGRRSVAFADVEEDRESVASGVSEKDVPTPKKGSRGKGKAATKTSPKKAEGTSVEETGKNKRGCKADTVDDDADVDIGKVESAGTSRKRGRSKQKKATSETGIAESLEMKQEIPKEEEAVKPRRGKRAAGDSESQEQADGIAKSKRVKKGTDQQKEIDDEQTEQESKSNRGRRASKKDEPQEEKEEEEVQSSRSSRGRRASKKEPEAVVEPETVGSKQGKRGAKAEAAVSDVCEQKATEMEPEIASRGRRGKTDDKAAVYRRSLPADELKEQGTPRKGRSSITFADVEEERESVASEVSEKDVPTSKKGSRGRGKAATKKTSPKKVENEETSVEDTGKNTEMEPEIASRGRGGKMDDKAAVSEVTNKGKGKVAAKSEDADVDDARSRSISSSRGKRDEDVKPVPAAQGRGRRSNQPAPADDDDTDSMSTISEASEISTASARVRRGKAAAQSPVTTPKQGARVKRTASMESKESLSTPSRGKKAAVEKFISPRSRNVAETQCHKIMFTGVVDDKGQKVVKDLGGELVTDTDKCTHLVTDRVRRTVKFLCCLARGIPIVSTDWLDRCAACKAFVDHTPFIVKDAENEKKYGFKLLTSLQKAAAHKLFAGYKIHVTKNVKPDPPSMKQILMSADGTYLPTMPKKEDAHTVIVSCEEDKRLCQAALNAGVRVVSNEFILTGLLQQSLDIEKYSLFTTDVAGGSSANKRQSEAANSSAKKRRR